MKTITDKEVGGYLYVSADLDAPALQSVGDYLYVRSDLDAPALQSVGGSLYVRSDLDAPALQSVGGSLDVSADLDAPALQSVGGYRIAELSKIDKAIFIGLTGACREGVEDFINKTGKTSMPLDALAKVLTDGDIYGAKTISWILRQRNRLRKLGQK